VSRPKPAGVKLPPMNHPKNGRGAKPHELTARNFPSAQQEAETRTPPSRYDGPESAYRLAFADPEFLLREDLRPVRMQLELLKPELIQQEQNIEGFVLVADDEFACPIGLAVAGMAHQGEGLIVQVAKERETPERVRLDIHGHSHPKREYFRRRCRSLIIFDGSGSRGNRIIRLPSGSTR